MHVLYCCIFLVAFVHVVDHGPEGGSISHESSGHPKAILLLYRVILRERESS